MDQAWSAAGEIDQAWLAVLPRGWLRIEERWK
jgi:hypothetical protein